MKNFLFLALINFIALNVNAQSVEKITIDAQNGKVSLSDSEDKPVKISYVRKGHQVEVIVKNVASNQEPQFTVLQEDVRYEGDSPAEPIKKDDFTIDTDDEEYEETKQLIQAIESNMMVLADKDATLDTLRIKMWQLELNGLLATYVKDAVQLNSQQSRAGLKVLIQSSINDYQAKLDGLIAINTLDDYSKAINCIQQLKLLIYKIDQLQFERHFYFNPEKEVVKIQLDMKETVEGTTVQRNVYGNSFITRRRAMLYGSVGVHGLVHTGYKQFVNKDSLIVSGKGNGITPSFGTYLNIGWRGNDYVGGFGFGSGIPINIDGSTDITPNFSGFATIAFPAGGGRLGIMLGAAIRRTTVLATGYRDGDNLGSTSASVPTMNVWKPNFMFGVSYNLAKD